MLKIVMIDLSGPNALNYKTNQKSLEALNQAFNEGFEVKVVQQGGDTCSTAILLHKPDTDAKSLYPQCPACGGHHEWMGGCPFAAESAKL